MTIRQALEWLNPLELLQLPTDWKMARRWGTRDARIADGPSREIATWSSLLLLHPLTHHRYWSAYQTATEEEK